MSVSLRAFDEPGVVSTLYERSNMRGGTSAHRRCRVGLVVANRAIVAAIFGEDAAMVLMEKVEKRAISFLGAAGDVVRQGADGVALILHGDAGFGTWGATRFIEAALRTIAARPVRYGDVDILPELSAVTEEGAVAPRRPSPQDAVRIASYVGAMADAARLAEAMGECALFLAWHPVVACGPDRTLLHYHATPHLPDTAGASLDPEDMMRAYQRIGMTELLDSHVVRLTIERLRKQPELRLACSISAASATVSAWWESIFAALRSAPQVAARLIVAIDQAAPFPSIAQAVIFADRMRGLGCQIALANFGAGQTAVGHLPMLAPDLVIVDRIFLRHVSGAEALGHLVGLARNYSSIVLVDGAETKDHMRRAEAAGASGFSGREAGAPRLALLTDVPTAPVSKPPAAIPAETSLPALPRPDVRRLRRGIAVAVCLSAFLWWGLIEMVRLIA
ncbi:EAL domain-containing protein [Sphingomonas sp. AP4-R1]|uniref:EAL domain-containing protein n=1 Tax=Sphingomonas sp. AP4-R1 TaxID=2735134 RepID=UPI001493AB3C|nr:EAL domain-containing protein [Sphingomonas sp. AP4-R1]QJU56997.1 EAL domain-containing protein [Sphingomonas sp. AP4-R1]